MFNKHFENISGARGNRIMRGPDPAKAKVMTVRGFHYHGFEIDGKLYVNLSRPIGRAGDCIRP